MADVCDNADDDDVTDVGDNADDDDVIADVGALLCKCNLARELPGDLTAAEKQFSANNSGLWSSFYMIMVMIMIIFVSMVITTIIILVYYYDDYLGDHYDYHHHPIYDELSFWSLSEFIVDGLSRSTIDLEKEKKSEQLARLKLTIPDCDWLIDKDQNAQMQPWENMTVVFFCLQFVRD